MKHGQSIQRVLIYRTGSLGDTLVALPCFHLIARVFPGAKRMLLTNLPVHAKAPAAMAVLGGSGLVHGEIIYPAGTRNIWYLLRLLWKIRRFRPDVLVYLMPVRPVEALRRDRLFFQLAGAGRVVGLPAVEDRARKLDSATGLYESEASRLARSLAVLGDADLEDIANWDLRLTIPERETGTKALADLKGRPLIVCGPGTKMQAKDWGKDKWRVLLARLYPKFPQHGLALIGAKEDANVSDYAAQEWTGLKVNLCGKLMPRETAAVLKNAQVFIGPDSGPMHLAASVGVPCVIAYSARGLPGIWFPAGQQHQIVYHRVSCYGCCLETCTEEARRCMTSITVDEMVAAVDRVQNS